MLLSPGSQKSNKRHTKKGCDYSLSHPGLELLVSGWMYALSTRKCYRAGFSLCVCVSACVCACVCAVGRERERGGGEGGVEFGTCGPLFDFWDPKWKNRRSAADGPALSLKAAHSLERWPTAPHVKHRRRSPSDVPAASPKFQYRAPSPPLPFLLLSGFPRSARSWRPGRVEHASR